MGVPALFRWLSKKYPKIVQSVSEEEAAKVEDVNGKEVEVPIDITTPNPNGVEFDNLYLDMNGIVHPCTHPEGKPAPETEEAMMVEIFNYTERIVNMIRPRKLLFMAIDGVAPRAKMNQQRSRRFRSSLDAKMKHEERLKALEEWKAMGKEVTEDEKMAWDSNAITPGTPFMDLLASSLRYWVVLKMNNDPGWKDLEVIISDSGVPGEGEHKIMDLIRRQRVYPQHNPNTNHVIYGLDADLIMLSLATHEPNFKVLREDVFAQDNNNACRICGQEGHYAANCTGKPKELVNPSDPASSPSKPPEKKPFIFLDVTILREYLFIELNIPLCPFPYDFERAIDDWVLLIFFVGNDFLPHLPSLEIREGAIDTLLRIWKTELPRMGGYLTNNGRLELSRVQIMLDGLASREDEIFQKRREAEQRQDSNAKRRKVEQAARAAVAPEVTPSPKPAAPTVPVQLGQNPLHPSLPMKPSFDTFAAAPPQNKTFEEGSKALGGSNHDIVANRSAIRMANMSAAEVLKAELAGLKPLKPKQPVPRTGAALLAPVTQTASLASISDTDGEIPGFGSVEEVVAQELVAEEISDANAAQDESALNVQVGEAEVEGDPNEPPPFTIEDNLEENAEDMTVDKMEDGQGVKRKLEDLNESLDQNGAEDNAEEATVERKTLKLNPDGTVEQEDTVRLWEPGYRERYYMQKFGVPLEDVELRKQITLKYVEGLAWVLAYYYQGVPSWKWFYPYHFAPFAADFNDVAKMEMNFELGEPFKPFEQLMGVFPAASKQHIPAVFHPLMTSPDSPIIDFYPEEFEIDMNGKKMSWQGVALLPFIDEARLLSAMAPLYGQIDEEEQRRNSRASSALFVSGDHPLHSFLESLYTKRRSDDPLVLDQRLSKGLAGSVLPDPTCVPEATYYCPLLPSQIPLVDPPMLDVYSDRSLSSLYYFPEQIRPHQSVLLNGVRRPVRTLTDADQEHVRRGGMRGRGGGPPPGYGNHSMHRENQRFTYPERPRNGFSGRGRPDFGPYGHEDPYSRPYPQQVNGHRPGNFGPPQMRQDVPAYPNYGYGPGGYDQSYRYPGRNNRG